ncbi:hypothetical protein FHQ26_10285 [Testudinibacter sp. TR-2022]|uniref:endonuclease/exonuclease/phosphatase family protein n=1 Tax=Testudinibacter sp. TR-2022 TaxID=2585029 RepID=UPI001119960E|nr:endonuclease/exonuclease/phosphatase family protein [Testudinibacter sp. TR-2022]TNH00181.1 hypothetical protein FHQ22_12270 [Pasteurellaceae bacterium Phil31]TNH06818.1 hypothetical protein FHQ25_11985 [Testudinibacter sp. TR-2022]TNH07366.1 hypothetical protein FHQ26_10285 [Testudinibacter sp. TR-2022]TNH11207.1 hypothetical protein FIA56_11535 [Testudinibacter sp. TR-2022]TNH16265.1 hypothetical protein FHQ23_09010 [Testudinibacter sp. TR-2022]
MKLLHLSGFIALLSSVGLFAAPLNVASYNIHHGAGEDEVLDLQRIANVLNKLDVDLVGLQEVDIANARTGFVSQGKYIAQQLQNAQNTPWKTLNAAAIEFENGEYGNAIIYKSDVLTLNDYKVVRLPDPDGDGQRSAGVATFTDKDGITFQFVASHLTHKNKTENGSTIQLASLKMIEETLDSKLPTIFVADFNASIRKEDNHNLDTMAYLIKNNWRIDSPLEGASIPDEPWIIDYVVSKNHDKLKVNSSQIVLDDLTKVASDHFPVKVNYQLEK